MTDQLSRIYEDARILVVDDEESNLCLLRRILEDGGYTEIRTTADGRSVPEIVEEFAPDVLLLDLHMPPPDGFAILRKLMPYLGPPTMLPVLVLTGDPTSAAKRLALSLGARDLLAKPFDAPEALLRIGNLLETKFLYRKLKQQNEELEIRVRERTGEVRHSQNEILARLARASEIRDDETGRHTQRVGELSAAIARAMKLGDHFEELISRAAPLHDVGKIGIPDAILLKPGRLTPEERALMESHTVIGAKILSGGKSEVMSMAERIALGHHEKWDGSGYPNKLCGTSIPIEARIVSVADCVDALTHNRPYRMAWPLLKVFDEIERCKGSHFDPDVVSALMTTEAHSRIVASPPHPWPALKDEHLRTPTLSSRR